jgi:hypothetical protein
LAGLRLPHIVIFTDDVEHWAGNALQVCHFFSYMEAIFHQEVLLKNILRHLSAAKDLAMTSGLN